MSNERPSPVAPGELVGGKYRVERVLGAGAMGVVVSAVHEELGERRAIKFLLSQSQDGAAQLERFMREARAAAKLKSAHVAHVFDVGKHTTADGRVLPYLVMEHLEGRDLYTLFHQEGPLSVERAVAFLLQACEGLAEAHALGIVHRDLKPANLFIEERKGAQALKVLDFGISKVQSGGQGAAELTETAMMIGSPSYMAPEQMRSSRSVDARADLWSLGVTLYQLVTGQLPFTGEDRIELCLKVVQDEPVPPTGVRADLPPAVDGVVRRCLQKLPEQRYADVAELAADLLSLAPSPANELLVERVVRNLGQDPGARPRAGSVPNPPRDAGTAAAWTGGTGSRATASPARSSRGPLAVGALLVAGAAGGIVYAATRPSVPATSEARTADPRPPPSATVRVEVTSTGAGSAGGAEPPPRASATEGAVTPAPTASAAAPAHPAGPGAPKAPPKAAEPKTAEPKTAAPPATAAPAPPPPTAKPDRHTF